MRWNLLLIAVLISICCLIAVSCTDDNPDSGRERPADAGGARPTDDGGDASTDDVLGDE